LHHLKKVKLRLTNQYIISFKGLPEGEHVFEFELKKAFFDEYDILEAKDGFIRINIVLIKKVQLLDLKISMDGNMEIPCDRCLEYFKYQIKLKNKLLVKFSEKEDENDDEIWYLNPNEYELNLKQYFLDSISTSLPLQKYHPVNSRNGSDGCDKEMLNIIDRHRFSSGGSENIDDPRWRELKNLLNDYNNNKNGTSET